MISFPNAKINLGLHILSKRKDGYHNLETVFYPLQIHDAIEVVQNPDSSSVQFSSTGFPIKGDWEQNLSVKAYHLIKSDFQNLEGLNIHLHKAIPIGAGLGGGSSDGGFTLKLINERFNLRIPLEKLLDYALILGSDCPFFIINKPCFATGRGEFLESIKIDLSEYKFGIVCPPIQIDTAQAFAKLNLPTGRKNSIKEVLAQPVETWRDNLNNDFEESVFADYPEIKKIKNDLYSNGALYASLSGSGSCVYGIFKKDKATQIKFPSDYFFKIVDVN